MPARPNMYIKLAPVPTIRKYSNCTSGTGVYANKTGVYVTEETSGTTRRKPRTQWIAPTAYTFTRMEWRAGVGSCIYWPQYPYSGGSQGTCIKGACMTVVGETGGAGDLANNLVSPLYSTDSAKADDGLRNAALIAARNKLKTTSVDLGIAFAERKQTTKLVGDTATRIAKSFTNLKRGNVRRAMQDLGISNKKREPRGSNITNQWLQMQYGVKPLLSDVYGSCDSLAKRNRDDWRVTAKASKHVTVERDDEGSYHSLAWHRRSFRGTKSVFVRIDATPANELLISLASLGVLNPLAVAWERTYLSFVVDWFLPIGNWLDSLDALVGYSVRGSSSSLLVRGEWVSKGIGLKTWYNGPNLVRQDNQWTGSVKMTYLNRQVGIASTIPNFPRFKDPRSLGHMANGLALLAGAFGRSPGRWGNLRLS